MEIKKMQVNVITAAEFERAVKEFFLVNYDFYEQDDVETGGYVFCTATNAVLSDPDLQKAHSRWLGSTYFFAPGPGYLLSVLAYNGRAEYGNYIIQA